MNLGCTTVEQLELQCRLTLDYHHIDGGFVFHQIRKGDGAGKCRWIIPIAKKKKNDNVCSRYDFSPNRGLFPLST
jgi:hypothetical protein